MRIRWILMLAVCCAAHLPVASGAAEPGPLVGAVLSGDPSRVRAALREGASVESVDPVVGLNALHAALAEGGPREPLVLEALLAASANVEAEDARGLSPLVSALVVSRTGPAAVIERTRAAALAERLLLAGAAADRVSSSGDTALRLAVATDNLQAVRLLLAHGANPLLRAAGRPSPLQLARATGRSADMIAMLEAARPRFAARGGAVSIPEEPPPENTPASESGSVSGWVIGAAAVVAAAAIAALVANQANRQRPMANAQASASAPVTVVQAPPASPPPAPRPPVHCLYGQLPGGGCKPPPPGQCVIIGGSRIGDCR